MARNYSLVVNSRFKPFTYDDFMKPILLATQAHRELEDAYSTLSSDTEELEKMLDANRDKMSYATYQNYIKQVNALADELNQKGLTANSRRSAIKAKDDYHQKIVPIKAGYNRRAEAEKAQQAMLSQDPTRLYARRASELSVDDYVNDQTLDVLSENYSGALLAKQVADQATQYVKWAKKNGQLRNIGLPYIYEQKITSGASPEEVFAAMREDPNALPFLQKVVNNVMESSGIANWTGINGDINNRIYQEALGYAKQGLPAFIGTNTWKDYTDQYNMQLALLKQKQSMAGTPPQYKGLQSNPNYLYSTDPNMIKKIRGWEKEGWIKKTSNGYEITAEGKKNLMPSETSGWVKSTAGYSRGVPKDVPKYKGPTEFGAFVLGDKAANYKNLSDDDINRALNYNLSDYQDFNNTDANQEIVHDLYLNPAQQAAWKDRLGEKRLSRAEYLGKGKGYKTGSAANPNELEDIDWKTVTPTRIRTSRYGNTILLQDKEGNRFEYMLPQNINQTFEGPIQQHIQSYYDAVDIGSKGYFPETNTDGTYKRDKNGNIVFSDKKMTDEQRAAWGAFTDAQYQPVDQYFANIGGTWGLNPSETQYGVVPTDIYNSVSPWYMGELIEKE